MVFGPAIWCRVFAVILPWFLPFSQKFAVFFKTIFAVIFYCPYLSLREAALSAVCRLCLQRYHDRIKKLEEKELTLEEMDMEDSTYLLIDR